MFLNELMNARKRGLLHLQEEPFVVLIFMTIICTLHQMERLVDVHVLCLSDLQSDGEAASGHPHVVCCDILHVDVAV